MKIKPQRIYIICLFFICLSVCLCSCYSRKELAYYADATNYIHATGRVHHIQYSDDMSEMYLGLSDLPPEFQDTNFKIVGKNLEIVQMRGIDEKLKIGDEISFVAAPLYLGDGYVVPIVAITVRGETLLDFTDGFENLQGWLNR